MSGEVRALVNEDDERADARGHRIMLATDIDPELRRMFKARARTQAGSVRAVLEALVRAYVDDRIPAHVLDRYLRGR
jgi:hypothetical protein